MPPDPADHSHQLPESLQRQLLSFRRQLWRRKVIESVAAGLIGLLLSFLLIFGFDRIWQTPSWLRLFVLVSGVSLMAGFAPYWMHRWIWGHRHDGQLAKLISRKFPRLGDRLLGVIELQGHPDQNESVSIRLREAAVESVAVEAQKREFGNALPAARHRKWGLAAVMLGLLSLGVFVVTPKAGVNALQRWLQPFSDIERYTFTQLEQAPKRITVPYGEAFTVTLRLAKDTEQSPETAFGTFESQPEVSANRRKKLYQFLFPGQQEDGVITFELGDLRHRLQVEPKQRPTVNRTTVIVKSPDYMQILERSVDLTIGDFSVVEGSELRFELETTRPLVSGKFGPTEISGEASQLELDNFNPVQGVLKLDGRQVSFGPLKAGNTAFTLPFSWKDEFGLIGGQDFKLRVNAASDEAPASYIQGIERKKAILPEEVMDFEILCEDDFGLRQAGIEWSSMGTMPGQENIEGGELIVRKGDPQQQRINEPVAFSPAAFGIGPQRLILRAFSEDYFPDRGRIYSEPIMIYVLSREEHAQLMKSSFDRIISELEDVARKELNLLDENQRIERLDAEELQSEEGKTRLAEQQQSERENRQLMEELAKRMEELMKDAARNGDIDSETMKKMAESMKSMKDLADKEMPEVEDKLAESAEPSNTQEKAKEDIEKAVTEQKEVIEKMNQALDQASDANKRFEAGTFVSRLKKAANDQNGIAATLIAKFAEILGVRTSEVDPADQRELVETSEQQVFTASDVRWIQEDLSHYHARTGDQTFKQVADLMQEAKIEVGLEDVRLKLGKNHSYKATEEAKEWANKLTEWAKILEGELEKNSAGGGGGGGPSPEDEDFEFMLRVMKMIQTEQDLRARTRVLEQFKRDTNAPTQTKP